MGCHRLAARGVGRWTDPDLRQLAAPTWEDSMTTVTDDSTRVRAAAEPRRSVRDRLSGDGLDLRNTWQAIAGALLLPIGIAVIILGWQGAAHGRVDQQQIPYLISGGILGLAVVVIGCFF